MNQKICQNFKQSVPDSPNFRPFTQCPGSADKSEKVSCAVLVPLEF